MCIRDSLHPELATRLHGGIYLMDARIADHVPYCRGRDHNLDRRDSRTPVLGGHELPGDDRLYGGRQLKPDLGLLERGEDIDNAVDALGSVLGVEGGEHQVAGLSRGQSGLDGLEVSHLTDQYDVGVLAQGVLQGVGERVRVRAHLALVDDALLVQVEELDRVLDGDDVLFPGGIYQVHDGGEGGGLALAGRAGHQDEPPGQPRELLDDHRQHQLFDRLYPVGDDPESRADAVPLEVGVHAEACAAGDRVGKVELQVGLEGLALAGGEDAVHHLTSVIAGQLRHVHALQHTVDPEHRRHAYRDVQVGSAPLDHFLQHLIDVQPQTLLCHSAPPIGYGLHNYPEDLFYRGYTLLDLIKTILAQRHHALVARQHGYLSRRPHVDDDLLDLLVDREHLVDSDPAPEACVVAERAALGVGFEDGHRLSVVRRKANLLKVLGLVDGLLSAPRAKLTREPLADDAVDGGRDEEGLDAHFDHSGYRGRRVIGMQGAQDLSIIHI